MKHIEKIILGGVIATGLIVSGIKYVRGEEVGEKMPTINKNVQVLATGIWMNDNKRGIWINLDDDGDFMPDYVINFSYCHKKMSVMPFGIFKGDESMLYVDKNYDNLIDYKVHIPIGQDRPISQDAPNCNKEVAV